MTTRIILRGREPVEVETIKSSPVPPKTWRVWHPYALDPMNLNDYEIFELHEYVKHGFPSVQFQVGLGNRLYAVGCEREIYELILAYCQRAFQHPKVPQEVAA